MDARLPAPMKSAGHARSPDEIRPLASPRESFEIATWQPVNLQAALLVTAFPSVGLVGSIATAHLVESLQLRDVGAVLAPALPPTAVVRGGVSTSPIRVYLGGMVCGIDGKCDQLCVVHSDIAPKTGVVTSLSYALVSWAKERRARQLVCLEGLRTEGESAEEAQILGIASDDEGRHLLEKMGIATLHDGILTGIGGVMLYAARAQGLSALCLLARTHEDFPDARGAARLLELLHPLVPLVSIDAQSLYDKAQVLEVAFREQLERSRREVNHLSQRADLMYG